MEQERQIYWTFCMVIMIWLWHAVQKLADVEQMTRLAQSAEVVWFVGMGCVGIVSLLDPETRPRLVRVLWSVVMCCSVGYAAANIAQHV